MKMILNTGSSQKIMAYRKKIVRDGINEHEKKVYLNKSFQSKSTLSPVADQSTLKIFSKKLIE